MIRIRKGLDIPVAPPPEQEIVDAQPVETVALLGRDYVWRKGSMLVREGDRVKLGQPVARDKKLTDIVGTAPGCGIIDAIHRGPKRVLDSIVVRLDGDDEIAFPEFSDGQIQDLDAATIRDNLLASGLWTALRTRPFSTLADPASRPYAVFVTAMDTNPMAPDPAVIIAAATEDFRRGVTLVSRLTLGRTWVCKAAGAPIPVASGGTVEVAEFSGPHPAGLVGTHIHFLAPVSATRTVWHIGYQDVIAIGRLFRTGRLDTERIVSLAGPAVRRPRLLRTRLGACSNDLVQGELDCVACRVVSGSVLSGHHASGHMAYLGRYHNQISVLSEGRERRFLGWLAPGRDVFSATRAFLSGILPAERFRMTTSQNGSPRAMVPIGTYERVMPLDILPTPLLRALVVEDTDTAQALGCLELDEEDIALCSYVDPGKYDFGPILRENLMRIMKEG